MKIILNKSKVEDLAYQIIKATVIGTGIDKYTNGKLTHAYVEAKYIPKIALRISEKKADFAINGPLTICYPYGIK